MFIVLVFCFVLSFRFYENAFFNILFVFCLFVRFYFAWFSRFVLFGGLGLVRIYFILSCFCGGLFLVLCFFSIRVCVGRLVLWGMVVFVGWFYGIELLGVGISF